MLCGSGAWSLSWKLLQLRARSKSVVEILINVCRHSEVVANMALTAAEERIPVEILTKLATDEVSG